MINCATPPEIPPRKPPRPVTVPTTFFEKTSAGRVMFPQAACPNITSASSAIAADCVGALVTPQQAASIPIDTHSMVVFLALLSVHPRLISQRGIAPQKRFPAISAANG